MFTQEYLIQNPACAELTERLNEAEAYYNKGDVADARLAAESVVNSCQEQVLKLSLPETNPLTFQLSTSIIISCVAAIILGLGYYSLARRRLMKGYVKKIKSKEEN